MRITYHKELKLDQYSFGKSQYVFYANQDIGKMKTQHKSQLKNIQQYIIRVCCHETTQMQGIKTLNNTTVHYSTTSSHCKTLQDKHKNKVKIKSINHKTCSKIKPIISTSSYSTSITLAKNNKANKTKFSNQESINTLMRSNQINRNNQYQCRDQMTEQIDRQNLRLDDESIMMIEDDLSFSTSSQRQSNTQVPYQYQQQQQVNISQQQQLSTKQHSIQSEIDKLFIKIKITEYLKTQTLKLN